MKKILIAWLGKTDIRAVTDSEAIGLGPIDQALLWQEFDSLEPISDAADKKVNAYCLWLKQIAPTPVNIHPVQLRTTTAATSTQPLSSALQTLERLTDHKQTSIIISAPAHRP